MRLEQAYRESGLSFCSSPEEIASLEPAWDRLARVAASPFLTHAWLSAWWRAFGGSDTVAAVLPGSGSTLRAAALLRQGSRTLRAAANAYSEEWDAIAADTAARSALWEELSHLPIDKLDLAGLSTGENLDVAEETLSSAGYRTARVAGQCSPFLDLPGSYAQLLAGLRSNQRSNVRRKDKRIKREGSLRLRTATAGEFDAAFEVFLQLEASGWKGRAGTAILSDPRAVQLYSEFGRAAAARGWLRLYLLELDGVPVAADYTCVFGGKAFLLKTCFDETHSQLAPGAVLRSEALAAAISEGLSCYEFLGGPDRYKLAWGAELHERQALLAYRRAGLAEYWYRHKLRPVGVQVARRALAVRQRSAE